MNRKLLITTTALLMTACATTPSELRERGTSADITLAQPAERAAQCIARNAENINLQARVAAKEASFEALVYRTTDGALDAVAIVDLRNAGSGSAGRATLSKGVLSPDKMRDTLLKGC